MYADLGVAQADLVQAGLLRNPVFDGIIRFPVSGGPADRPALQPAFSLAQREMSHGAHGAASTHSPSAVGEGKVITVMPEKSQIIVDHKDIPGVMGAMTMGYTVTPPSLLTPLKAGDTIRFTLDTQTQTIINIEKLHK